MAGDSGSNDLIGSLIEALPERRAEKLRGFSADPFTEVGRHDLRRHSPMIELNLASIPRLQETPAARSRIKRHWLALTAYRHWEFQVETREGSKGQNQKQGREEMRQRGWDCRLLDELLARGQGLIVMTFHVGPFQLLARDLALGGYAPNLAVHQYTRISNDQRPDAPTYVELTDRGATLRLAEVLRGGGVVVIVADGFTGPGQDLCDRHHSAAQVLGLPLRMPNGTFRLAAALGAPVLPVTAPRSARYPNGRIQHHGPLVPGRKLRGIGCEKFVHGGMIAAYKLLGSSIEEHPEAYGNLPRLHHFRVPSAPRNALTPSAHLEANMEVHRLVSQGARFRFKEELGVLARVNGTPIWLDVGLRAHSFPSTKHWVVKRLAKAGLDPSDLEILQRHDRDTVLSLVGSLWAKGLLSASHPESEVAS